MAVHDRLLLRGRAVRLKQSEWSVTKLDDHTWQISHKPANDYGGAICIAVAKDNPWPVYGTQELARPAPD